MRRRASLFLRRESRAASVASRAERVGFGVNIEHKCGGTRQPEGRGLAHLMEGAQGGSRDATSPSRCDQLTFAIPVPQPVTRGGMASSWHDASQSKLSFIDDPLPLPLAQESLKWNLSSK